MAFIETHGGFKNLSPSPDIAFQWQDNGAAWPSVAAAHAGTPESYRAIGKVRFIDIGDGRGVIEYMYRNGAELADLVPRYENLESAQQYLEAITQKVGEAEYHAEQSRLFSEVSSASYDQKGPYDPIANVPPLTADASANPGPKPKEYTISRSGPLLFATEGQLAGYLVEENDTLRELSNGKWLVHRDPNSKKVSDLQKLTRITIPFTEPFTGESHDDGTAIPSNGSIQVPNGSKGEGTVLVKKFDLATYPSIQVGDTLSFACYITENIAGISSASGVNRLVNNLFAVRNGATINAAVTNKLQTRLTETSLVFTYDYVVVAGDTILFEIISKGNSTNSSGSMWVWQVTRAELVRKTLRVGANLLEDSLFLQNKRLTDAEKLLSATAEDVSAISEKITFPNLADPALFEHGKVMGTDGIILSNASYCLSGKIPVKELLPYAGRTSLINNMRYGVFFSAADVILGGFNSTWTAGFTPPAGTAYVRVTVLDSESTTFMFEQAAASTTFLAFGESRMIETSISADYIQPTPSKQLVSSTQITNWDKGAAAGEKIVRKNLIDPSKVTQDKIMQSSGVTVNSTAWVYSDFLPVTPGLRYRGNSSVASSYRYACCYNAAKVRVPGGWDTQWKDDFTCPVDVFFIILTIVKTELSTAYFEQAETLNGFTPYSDMQTLGLHQPANYVVESPTRAFVTPTAKARLDKLSFLDTSLFSELEMKGIMPRESFAPSPFKKELSVFYDYLLQGDGDLITDTKNGSKSTGVAGYCSPTVNSNLLPEFCREENFHTKWCRHMLENYFIGQKQERFDTAGRFTITGDVTVTATNNARHWGHQWPDSTTGLDYGGPVPNGQVFIDTYYQIIKPNTGNATITFGLPDSNYKMAWILRHSHLTGILSFSVAGGANRLEYLVDRDTDTWAELHGANTYDTSTPDSFKTGVNYTNGGVTSTKIRLDQYSMPLIIRRKAGFTISGTILITATMLGGKQIEHWGIYYTRSKRLFIPSSSAMGSHDASSLEPFDETGIDKRKPQWIFYDADIVNQWRQPTISPTDTPTQYANRIGAYATTLVGKAYVKGLLVTFDMWHKNMNLFETTSDMPTEYLTSEGYNNGLDYMNRAKKVVTALVSLPANVGRMAVIDTQPGCMNYNNKLAKDQNITRSSAQWINKASDPPNALSLLMDGTHNGNNGEENKWRLVRPVFNAG